MGSLQFSFHFYHSQLGLLLSCRFTHVTIIYTFRVFYQMFCHGCIFCHGQSLLLAAIVRVSVVIFYHCKGNNKYAKRNDNRYQEFFHVLYPQLAVISV